MACTETFLTLRIFSPDIDSIEISKLLSIEASSIKVKDPTHKYRSRRDYHIWCWSTSDKLDSTDNVVHLNFLLENVVGKEAVLKQLRCLGCKTHITNYWDSTGQGGPSLTSEIMGKLCDLGLGISWDIYFSDEPKT